MWVILNRLHEIRNGLKEEKEENTMKTRIEDIVNISTDSSVSSIATADTTYNNSSMIGFETIIIGAVTAVIFGFMYFCCFAGKSNKSSKDLLKWKEMKHHGSKDILKWKRMQHGRLESQF